MPVQPRHQDPAEREVAVELGRGVLGQLEQGAQLTPGPGVRLDAHVGHLGRPLSGHQNSFTRMARV
ncbi:hypothetical protein [Frankia canadensis]|uniref:hypothetical protein n=1 Tax=Frankia canadensis TaxID=1836972 RepID=UPI001FB0000D|nr:hypothetical protein [Frankia canadensis]